MRRRRRRCRRTGELHLRALVTPDSQESYVVFDGDPRTTPPRMVTEAVRISWFTTAGRLHRRRHRRRQAGHHAHPRQAPAGVGLDDRSLGRGARRARRQRRPAPHAPLPVAPIERPTRRWRWCASTASRTPARRAASLTFSPGAVAPMATRNGSKCSLVGCAQRRARRARAPRGQRVEVVARDHVGEPGVEACAQPAHRRRPPPHLPEVVHDRARADDEHAARAQAASARPIAISAAGDAVGNESCTTGTSAAG